MYHHFNVEIATRYGMEAAIIFENIVYIWNQKRFDTDGKAWVYNSVQSFQKLYPYMTIYSIKKALKKLEEDGLIESETRNDTYDHTKSYTVTEKGVSLYKNSNALSADEINQSNVRNESNDCAKSTNRKNEIDQSYNIYNNINLDNNNRVNNRDNNNNMSGAPDDVAEKSETIISYMNKICGSAYKSTTSATRRLISARLKEGFTETDFMSVIEYKYSEWHNDAKMSQYLRPQTLFGTKFESYLQQANKHKPVEQKSTANDSAKPQAMPDELRQFEYSDGSFDVTGAISAVDRLSEQSVKWLHSNYIF